MSPAAPVTHRTRSTGGRRLTAGLAAANVVGVGLYLWWASRVWLPPAERAAGVTPQSGEAVVWAGGVLPLWALFGAVDALWAVWVLVPPPRWRAAGVVLAVAAVWAVAIAVDAAHY